MLFLLNVLLLATVCVAMPVKTSPKMENYLETFLDLYFEENIAPELKLSQSDDSSRKFIVDDGDDEMQGDQPVPDAKNINSHYRVNTSRYPNSADFFRESRQREKDNEDDRIKDSWKNTLKQKLLQQLGRTNATDTNNVTSLMHSFNNGTNHSDDNFITEKIRSFYPLCEVPKTTEQEIWKDSNNMNLFFNFDQMEGDIVTATLRLYRIFNQNITNPTDNSFEAHSDEEKLLHITIYYYTKSPRKTKVKRKLCDSKVVNLSNKWVDLSVLPAAKAWVKGRNLGLALQVEDQDGVVQKADTLFKGPACMVGSSTPKPIPSILFDPSGPTGHLDRINGLVGGDAAAALHFNPPMYPTIDICTVEVPPNHTHPIDYSTLRTCNVRPIPIELKPQILERLQMPARHIRHQRQHQDKSRRNPDPRSHMVQTKVIFTNAEVQNMTRYKR